MPSGTTCSREVAADGVERVVSAGDQLLHHRSEFFGARVGLRDLVERRAAKRLFAEALFEADRVLGLDEHRQAELLGCVAGLLRRAGVVRAGRVDACERCGVELFALALHALEQVPRGKGSKDLQVAEMLRDQVELAVVCRKDDDLAERTNRGDEPLRIRAGISAQKRLGVARAETERARTMVDGENADACAAERANRREPVDPADVHDRSGHLVLCSNSSSSRPILPSVREATHIRPRFETPSPMRPCENKGAVCRRFGKRDRSWGLTQNSASWDMPR